MMDLKNRIKNVFHNCQNQIDAILIKNGSDGFIDKNFFYVTGINQGLFEGCMTILMPDGTTHLLVTSLEEEIAHKTTAKVHTFKTKKDLLILTDVILDSLHHIGVNATSLQYSDYLTLSKYLEKKEFVDISKAFNTTRMVKDSSEIALIKKSCQIADRVAEQIPSFIRNEMSENELAAEIDYHLQRFGAKKPSFETISSVGPNTAMPHYSHGNTKITKENFVLCDFGATVDNYHSDITRTFIYGKGTEKQKKIYDTVKKAQQIAFESIEPGISAKKVHQLTFEFIQETPFKDRFIHSTGHSLGLNVHDPGIGFNPHCDEILQENMVLTVEPGIYLPGFGGVRIEDDIIITKNGYESLSRCSKCLIEI